jgi:hypothetical protein
MHRNYPGNFKTVRDYDSELLNNISKGFEIIPFINFKISIGMPNGPVAFVEFKLLISSTIYREVIG